MPEKRIEKEILDLYLGAIWNQVMDTSYMNEKPLLYKPGNCPNCGKLYILSNQHVTEPDNYTIKYVAHEDAVLDHPLTENLSGCDEPLTFEPQSTLFYPLPAISRREREVNQLLFNMSNVRKLVLGCFASYRNGQDLWGFIPYSGGEPFGWELIESYMVNGYLPPVGICNLKMDRDRLNSDFTRTRYDRWLVDGCLESLSQARIRLAEQADNLGNLNRLC